MQGRDRSSRQAGRRCPVSSGALEAGNNRPDIKGGNAHFLLLERGQAAEHFVVVFIYRVAVCDLFLEAFVRALFSSSVSSAGRYRRVSSQGISAELRRTGVSVFVLDRGLNSFDWSENNSNLPTGDRFEPV